MSSSRLGARLLLPFLGLAAVLLLWAVVSQTVAADLPSPWKTWLESKRYILEPFFKDGEMNQGIGRLAFYSLVRVAKGYLLALAIGTPIGFFLGLSRGFHSAFDPIIQFLRPISPLAWLPLGLVVFQKSEPAAVFTIALCAMWPTVINTAVGVRGISPDYLNVGRVLKLSKLKMMTKIIIPASLPYVFTGYRLSLGIAWLVIAAAVHVLGGIDLCLDDGEFVAIVGYSGSGKTTLVSLIAGLMPADAGTIVLDGQAVTGPGPERGIVFQQYSLLPWMSVYDNVALAVDAVNARLPAAERRRLTEDFISLVNLTPAIGKRPRELSGGMRQRVAVAR